jgi:hypothetical protein
MEEEKKELQEQPEQPEKPEDRKKEADSGMILGMCLGLAIGTGVGLRYDLGMLVLRFDVGVPIHDPSEKSGKYYNTSGSFFGNLGYHLAIGYPF